MHGMEWNEMKTNISLIWIESSSSAFIAMYCIALYVIFGLSQNEICKQASTIHGANPYYCYHFDDFNAIDHPSIRRRHCCFFPVLFLGFVFQFFSLSFWFFSCLCPCLCPCLCLCVCIFFIIVVIFLMNSTEQTNQFWSHRFIRRFINLLLLLLLPSLLFFCCSLTVHSPKTLIDNLHSRLCERTRMNGMERNRMECQAGGWTWKYEVKILYNYVNLILSIRFFRSSS